MGIFLTYARVPDAKNPPYPPNFTKITGKSDVLKMFFRKTPSYNPTILQMNFFSNYYYLLYILLSVSYVVFAVFAVL